MSSMTSAVCERVQSVALYSARWAQSGALQSARPAQSVTLESAAWVPWKKGVVPEKPNLCIYAVRAAKILALY